MAATSAALGAPPGPSLALRQVQSGGARNAAAPAPSDGHSAPRGGGVRYSTVAALLAVTAIIAYLLGAITTLVMMMRAQGTVRVRGLVLGVRAVVYYLRVVKHCESTAFCT